MFGRKAATQGQHLILDRLNDGIAEAGIAEGGKDGIVQVAVAEVRDAQNLCVGVEHGKSGVHPRKERLDVVERQGDISVDGGFAGQR